MRLLTAWNTFHVESESDPGCLISLRVFSALPFLSFPWSIISIISPFIFLGSRCMSWCRCLPIDRCAAPFLTHDGPSLPRAGPHGRHNRSRVGTDDISSADEIGGAKTYSTTDVPIQQRPFTIGPDSATFTIGRRQDQHRLSTQTTLKNSMLVSVGYLELANTGDFAANVWNEIPVRTYAAVLMVIGGTLSPSYFHSRMLG